MLVHAFYIKCAKEHHAQVLSVFSKISRRKPEYKILKYESMFGGAMFLIETSRSYEVTAHWVQELTRWLP